MKEDYEKLADVRIKKAMELYKTENNQMALDTALVGDGFWKLEITPDAGHNYYYIMEAIYRYHKINPNDEIDKYYYNTLETMAGYCTSTKRVSSFLNILMAELDYEKQKISPFEINIVEILKIFRDRLTTNPKLYEKPELMEKVNEYDSYINEKHGYKVL